MIGASLILLGLMGGAIFGPVLLGIDPNQLSQAQLSPPSWQHWGGTDFLGRDIMTRLLCGARISLLVGLVGALVSLVIGVAWGAVAASLGGKIDNAMMRVVDILYALPTLIFVIVLITVLEKPVATLLAAVGGAHWVAQARMVLLFVGLGGLEWLTMARVVRGQVLVLKEAQFVQAARVMGQGEILILWRHILPNLLGLVAVYLTLSIPAVILLESFLSFLGLGVQAPAASLGTLLADGAQVINPIRIAWWMLVFPGAFMALLLLSLNFLGDGLRDILDPRSLLKR
jgi:peptide/nickel transport system permease protein/oligopeptide transport system permease protein